MLRATLRPISPGHDAHPLLQSKPQVAATPRLEAEGEDECRRRRIEEAIGELDSMIGLSSVKKLVSEVGAFCEVQRLRTREHLISQPTTMHTVFTGHPGTGKTTVARLFGRLFREMGVLSKGHVVEVERADLVGEYIGHTAQRTRDQVKRALGGVLFIDEAYSLARGGDKDFGREAIDCLVKGMEDHKDELILILAGYPAEMDLFLHTNPGLKSRFPLHLHFPDYSVDELVEIGELMLSQRQYHLELRARTKLAALVSQRQFNEENPGNARTVRNLVESAIRRQAVRLMQQSSWSREQLMTLRSEDFRGL